MKIHKASSLYNDAVTVKDGLLITKVEHPKSPEPPFVLIVDIPLIINTLEDGLLDFNGQRVDSYWEIQPKKVFVVLYLDDSYYSVRGRTLIL